MDPFASLRARGSFSNWYPVNFPYPLLAFTRFRIRYFISFYSVFLCVVSYSGTALWGYGAMAIDGRWLGKWNWGFYGDDEFGIDLGFGCPVFFPWVCPTNMSACMASAWYGSSSTPRSALCKAPPPPTGVSTVAHQILKGVCTAICCTVQRCW
ncbi:hypothetical protein BDN72DRAFT_374735 [Pluteus cervinus]|uniref:Uncharacterized protein n=1 Tax=Pluteus cervinus TaxID=181527 RepID=A0ACD3B3N4_9AGAR|nr:hypothetical protein BDN72DRAFT_374735 [Pluteus cervinus]